jgi:DNA-binding XRE family transcriptional regulator
MDTFHAAICNLSGHSAQALCVPGPVIPVRLLQGVRYRHGHTHKGMSAEQMAGRLGMERESVLRLEREAMTRANPEKQAEYADILQIQPEALWRPPSDPSLDTLVEQAPPEKRELAHDMAANLRRFVSGKS